MCGICGIVTRDGGVAQEATLKMCRALEHRGPDDEGIECIPHLSGWVVGLGNRRLKVIDLSPAGHQPMRDEATGAWIVFNGEIYNYHELRRSLNAQGHEFRSRSDTEVLLKLLGRGGVAALSQLRGMFGLAMFSPHEGRLLLARDRLGIKPLYYASLPDGGLAFASEVRALMASGVVRRQVSFKGLDSFLSYGSIQSPLTILEGIQSLLPGCHLDAKLGQPPVPARFWAPPKTANSSLPASSECQVERVRAALLESCRLHLVSDVPVGLALSGGIDSSSLGLLCQNLGIMPRLITVTFDEGGFSEHEYARLLAQQSGAPYSEIRVDRDTIEQACNGFLKSIDQPCIDGLNVFLLSRAARQAGLTVLLTGLGGDELFGGYPSFTRAANLSRALALLSLLPYRSRAGIAHLLRWAFSHLICEKLATLAVGNPSVVFQVALAHQLFSPWQKSWLLDMPVEKVSAESIPGIPPEVVSLISSWIRQCELFSSVSIAELALYVGNVLLRDSDVMSMAQSIELRVPFLDHRLVEIVLSMPQAIKRNAPAPKSLLVRAVKDLPDSIVFRRKQGFFVPIETWLQQGHLRCLFDEVFAGWHASSELPIRANRARLLWHAFLKTPRRVGWSRVWSLGILRMWENRVLGNSFRVVD